MQDFETKSKNNKRLKNFKKSKISKKIQNFKKKIQNF